MKIGIVSIQDEWMFRNYGSLFQCYALQQILKRAGHTPFLIRRRLDNFEWTPSLFLKRLVWVLLHPISYLKGKIWTKQQAAYADITAKSFQEFFHEHITSTPQQYGEKELMEFPPDADCYICGSDQVWTSSIPSTFLLFAEGSKRIAYAASCNWFIADKEWKKLARCALTQFQAISVREKAGCEICRSLLEESGQTVSLAIDPVLLLEPDAWHHLSQKEECSSPPRNTCYCKPWELLLLLISAGMPFFNMLRKTN